MTGIWRKRLRQADRLKALSILQAKVYQDGVATGRKQLRAKATAFETPAKDASFTRNGKEARVLVKSAKTSHRG
jgi:hypothetical protein